jgi:hypothetical protein
VRGVLGRSNPDIIAARKAQVLELEPRVYRETYNVYATADVGPLLYKIQTPALVMTGAFDPSCGPAPNKKMAEALPRGELTLLPDHRRIPLAPRGCHAVPTRRKRDKIGSFQALLCRAPVDPRARELRPFRCIVPPISTDTLDPMGPLNECGTA